MLFRLQYNLKKDPHQYVNLFGDAKGIANLYLQLTENVVKKKDAVCPIGEIKIFNYLNMDVTHRVYKDLDSATMALTMLDP